MYSLNTRKRSSNTKFVRRFKSCTPRLLSHRESSRVFSRRAELPERLRGSTRSLHLFFWLREQKEKKRKNFRKKKRRTIIPSRYFFTHKLHIHTHAKTRKRYDFSLAFGGVYHVRPRFQPVRSIRSSRLMVGYCREFAFRFLPRKKRTKILCASSSSSSGGA